jgi:tetratricopeptide (TPR) repeat protein
MSIALCLLLPVLGATAPAAPTPAPASASGSTNPHIAKGLGLFADGLLQEADEALQEAFANPRNTPADAVNLQVLDGMLRAVSADDDLARAAFGRALQLDPAVVLPPSATSRVRRLFEQAKRERELRTAGPSLASQVEKLSVEGKLDGAEALVAGASKAEAGQALVLKGLVLVLKGLQKAGPAEAEKAKAAQGVERQLQVAEQQLASNAAAAASESESAQQLVLKGMLLMVKGLVKAEAGDEAQAKAIFAQALELDPGAKLPAIATPRAQKVFEEAKAAAAVSAPREPRTARGLPGEVARLYAEGKLERAELLLARNAERADLSKAESGQVFVLKGLLLVLKGLQKAGPKEKDRARAAAGAEGELRAVEEQLASTDRGSLSEAEASQQLVLRGLVLMVKGLVKAEAGKEAQAREVFAQALEIDPDAKLPAAGAPKVQKLFERSKEAAVAAAGPEPRALPENLAKLYADGRLDRAELVLAEAGGRSDLTGDQAAQVFVLKGMLQILRGLQRGSPAADAAPQLKVIEERLAAGADAPRAGADLAQRRLLEGMALVLKGVVQAESGDEARARESFERGLALAPEVRLPAVAGLKARKLFEAAKASGAGRADLSPPFWLDRPPYLSLLEGRPSPARTAGWGFTAGGAALLAGGAVSGVVALNAFRAEQQASANNDGFAFTSSKNTALVARNVADGLYIGGVVALGVGTFLLWQTRGDGGPEH